MASAAIVFLVMFSLRNCSPELKLRPTPSIFGKRVVGIAVEPALMRLGRRDHRMTRRTCMLRGMTVGRVVAAIRPAAFLTRAEVDPSRADFHAVVAFASFGLLDAVYGLDMCASLFRHGDPLLVKHLMNK